MLALDEHRAAYDAVLWTSADGQKKKEQTQVEQRWFHRVFEWLETTKTQIGPAIGPSIRALGMPVRAHRVPFVGAGEESEMLVARPLVVVGMAVGLLAASGGIRADWPQYMRNAGNTGVTGVEIDPAALGLEAQVALGDAILSSPIVVAGSAYVVDQMGTAYAVDIGAGKLLWKTAPEGPGTVGANTSTVAYLDGELVYGTTAGQLHWLRARDGRVVRTIDLGWPVVSPVTVENGRIYVATVDSSVWSFGSDGRLRWRWEHSGLAERWQGTGLQGDSDPPHFGGAPVAVYGDRVIAPLGYDLVCLDDAGDSPEELWRVRRPVSRFDVAMAASTDGQYVYAAWPKSDGQGALVRHCLADGGAQREPDVIRGQWAVYTPPAVCGNSVFFSRHAFGVSRFDFVAGQPPHAVWRAFENTLRGVEPSIAAVAVTPRHVVMTTLYGHLRVVARDADSGAFGGQATESYRYVTPSESMITSEPVVAAQRVLFGSDDGCLYILGPNGQAAGRDHSPAVLQRRTGVAAGSGERESEDALATKEEWPSAFGSGANTSFVADRRVKPPLRLRWALRSYGDFKHPPVSAAGELISVSLAGLVVCREQASGRVRWRKKLPGQAWSRASALCAEGKIYVPRVGSPRYAFVVDQPDAIYCLDQFSGQVRWQHAIGRSDWLRASPVYAEGVVAYGSKYETPHGARPLIGAGALWRVAGESAPPEWPQPGFPDDSWSQRRFGEGARRSDPAFQPGELLQLRRDFQLSPEDLERLTAGDEQLGLIAGPHDELVVWLNGEAVYGNQTDDDPSSGSWRYQGEAARFVPLETASEHALPGGNVLAVAVRRARVRSNVSSTSSVFPPRLVVADPQARTGPVIDAWDAQTGEPRWQIPLSAAGRYIEGPAGASRGGVLYFTGGGSDPHGQGETVAIEAASGQTLWSTTQAFASRTATPSLSQNLLILPGSHRLPLAALSLDSGELVWQQSRWTRREFVHAASLTEHLFTVNTKYRGGALLYQLHTGERWEDPEEEINVAGLGHTCGTIVLLASGYAVAATNRGIFFTNIRTGEIAYQTPGFASQTCPHPVVAQGRMFFAPQDSGMIYCFEPAEEAPGE